MTSPQSHALPVMMGVSLAAHAAGAIAWLYLNQISKKNQMSVISNVELLVKTSQPRVAVPVRRAPAMKPSTWNFLKMALPAVPKVRQPLEIKSPLEEKKKLLDIPNRLEENRKQMEKKLDMSQRLDMNRQMKLANVDAARLETHASRAALAEVPKLEDVGQRRASKAVLDMAQAMEERQGRLQPQALPTTMHEERHAAPAIQPMALPEEQGEAPRRGLLGKMSDLLTSEEPSLPAAQTGSLSTKRLDAFEPAALPKKESSAMAAKSKKAVELEGQIAHRKVVYYELPKFPQWLAARGVIEAEVKIYFLVNPDGNVLEDGMRADHTSGFGQLDRLAMDSLKNWRFESLSGGSGNQWGIITFRFILE